MSACKSLILISNSSFINIFLVQCQFIVCWLHGPIEAHTATGDTRVTLLCTIEYGIIPYFSPHHHWKSQFLCHFTSVWPNVIKKKWLDVYFISVNENGLDMGKLQHCPQQNWLSFLNMQKSHEHADLFHIATLYRSNIDQCKFIILLSYIDQCKFIIITVNGKMLTLLTRNSLD